MYLVDFVVILFVFSCRAATVTCRPTDDDANSNELRTLSEQMLRLVDLESIPHLTDAASPVPDYMTVLYRDIEESESSHHTPHSGSVWGLQPRAGEFLMTVSKYTFRTLSIEQNLIFGIFKTIHYNSISYFFIQQLQDNSKHKNDIVEHLLIQ